MANLGRTARWSNLALTPQSRLPLASAGVALAAGLGLGLALSSSRGELVVSLIFLGASVLFTVRHPLEGLLLTVILHPFVTFFYLVLEMGSGVPDISLTRVTLTLVFALVLAQAAIGRRKLPRLTWLDILMALSSLAMIVAALRGRSATTGLQWMFDMFVAPYVIYYVVKNLVAARGNLQQILWVIAFVGAYNGLYGIYTQTTGHILFISEEGLTASSLWYSETLRVMRGLLDSPHIFGIVFGLSIPVQFYLFITARTPNAKLLAGLCLALTVGGLFFTYRRTAYIGALASLLVLQFFFPRFRRLFLSIVVLAGFVVWLTGDLIVDNAVVQERITDRADTLNGRTDLWTRAVNYANRESWLGYGYGNFLARTQQQAIESHYLWLLVDGGLFALAPYAAILLLWIAAGIKLYRSRRAGLLAEPDLIGVFLAVVIAYLVNLSTAVINHDLPHLLIFLLAGGVIGASEAQLNAQRSLASSAVAPVGGASPGYSA
jgi:O-antigen ligase